MAVRVIRYANCTNVKYPANRSLIRISEPKVHFMKLLSIAVNPDDSPLLADIISGVYSASTAVNAIGIVKYLPIEYSPTLGNAQVRLNITLTANAEAN